MDGKFEGGLAHEPGTNEHFMDKDVYEEIKEAGKSLDSFSDQAKKDMFTEALNILNSDDPTLTKERKLALINIMENKYPEESFEINASDKWIISNPSIH